MCDIEKQPPTGPRRLQCPGFTLVDTPGFDDRASTKNEELDALICPFPRRGACLMHEQALLPRVEPHLNMLPSATNGSFALLREELCSLQKVVHSVGGTMREFRKHECKDRNAIDDLSRHHHIALEELRECTKMHGPRSGCMPHCTEFDEGRYVERQQPSPYGPLQSLRRCIAKAVERARLKIDTTIRWDSKWHMLSKSSPNASHTQPNFGKGEQSGAHSESSMLGNDTGYRRAELYGLGGIG